MDQSSIAKRTRSREAAYFRLAHEEIKRSRGAGGPNRGGGGPNGGGAGPNGGGGGPNEGGAGGSSTGPSRGRGGGSAGPSRGGGGSSSTGPSNDNVFVIDGEDEEEERRRSKLKRQRYISNRMTQDVQNNNGRQREEAQRTVRERGRARQEAETKEGSYRGGIYYRSDRKKEEEEAHRKILEWRQRREASMINGNGSTSSLKGKNKMNFQGSSKYHKNVVHSTDDEETVSDSSSESSTESEFASSTDDSDDDNSEDEDFDANEDEEDEEDLDEEEEEEFESAEDSDPDIAVPKQQKAKGKAVLKQQKAKAKAKVEVKENKIYIDLEDEVEEETIAAEKRSKKNISSDSAQQALIDDCDDGIALAENQNTNADVEVIEQRTYVGLEEVETITAKKSSNRNIVGESARQALSDDSDGGIALPENQKANSDAEAKEHSTFVGLEDVMEVTIMAEKSSNRNTVGESAHQALADDSGGGTALLRKQNANGFVELKEKGMFFGLEDGVEVETVTAKKSSSRCIVVDSTNQALSDDAGTALPENQNVNADAEVKEQSASVGLEDVVEEEKITAKKSSNRNIVGESTNQALADDSGDGTALPRKQNANADIEIKEQGIIVSLEDVVEVEKITAKKNSNRNMAGESTHQTIGDDSGVGATLLRKQNANADVEIKEQVVGLEDVVEVETITAQKSSNKNIVGGLAHQALGDDSGDDNAFPMKQNASAYAEVKEKRTSVDLEEDKVEAKKTLKRKGVSELGVQVPPKREKKKPMPCIVEATRVESDSTPSVEQKTEKKTFRSRLLRVDTENHAPQTGKLGDCQKSMGCYDTVNHSLSDDDAHTDDLGIDNDVEDDDLGVDDVGEVDDVVIDEDADADEYLLDDDIDVAEMEGGPTMDPIYKIFVNTIWEKGEMLQQENETAEVEPSVAEPVNIYKFNFGVEECVPEEKSDHEKEMDLLWSEFDFAQISCETNTAAASTVTIEEDEEQQVETNSFASCRVGKHEFILDEEIGVRCMFCFYLRQEIRYILPAFATSCARERPSRKLSPDDAEFSMFDSFPCHVAGGDQDSNVHTTGTVWDKFPTVKDNLYPHQIEGFEFLWRNLAGGIQLDGKNKKPPHGIGGCIISHAPGTGKTLLTIAFLRSFMEINRDCRPVLMAPSSMLLTWEEEFKKWKVDIPFHNISSVDFSGREDVAARRLVQNKRGVKYIRMVKTLSWSRGNSVLGISYQLYEKLTAERTGGEKEDKEKEALRKILLEKPTLLILDEGHTPRNTSSNIFKCLQKVRAKRRVILSGTPFQNNFEELYNTLSLVRPKFADKISSKRNQSRKKGTKALESGEQSRENWASFTSSIGKSSDDGSLAEIRRMIEPFVHVHEGSILEKQLPGLRECVVVLHPTPLQRQLLEEIKEGIKNSFEVDRAVALTSVHPSLLIKCFLAKQSSQEKCCINTLIENNQLIKEEAFRSNYHEGVKTRFLMQLIKLSAAMNEKVLVFSQFRHPKSLIEDHLHSDFGWSLGEEILQMDGSLDVNKRQALINRFNDPDSQVKVMLASIKACGEGISLIGASRIVMLDVVWNPSVAKQAISRAYRLGQKKVVYTYHLITSGTSEENKYCRQVHKHQLSQSIFFAKQGKTENPTNTSSKVESDDKILEAMLENNEQKDMFNKIIYHPKESVLLETFGAAVPSRLV